MNSGSNETASLIINRGAADQTFISQRPFPVWIAGLSALLILAVFHQTSASFVTSWKSSRTFAHGFFVLPVFFYLIWLRRERIPWQQAKPQLWALPLLLVSGLAWSLGAFAGVTVLEQFALLAIVVAAVWTVLGSRVVRALRFPLAFLLFAVPFGENIVGPLQDFTAWFAVTALRLTNVPSILENRTIYLPSGAWSVAEACSGIRYLISSIVLGLVFSSLAYRSWKRRLVFMLAATIVPILGNGFRAYGIILLGYLSNNRLAVGVDHIIYGFVFFVFLELALMLIGLKWRQVPETASSPPSQGASLSERFNPARTVLAACCAVALVGWIPPAVGHFSLRDSAPATRLTQQLPLVSPPWQPTVGSDDKWTASLHPDREMRQSYGVEGQQVDVYLAGYDQHRVELVEGYNLSRAPHEWFGGVSQTRDVVIDGKHLAVEQRLLQSTSTSRVVWIWYWIGAEFTANPEKLKLLQLKNRLLHRSDDAGVVEVSAEYQDNLGEAQERLQNFLAHASMRSAFDGSSR